MSSPTAPTRGAYLALLAALLGWLFDGMEMGVFSIVGRPALQDLLPRSYATPPTPEELKSAVGFWFSIIIASFLVGAATGGVLFGWLGDRIGRVRAMTLSVVTYALFTFLCGFADSAWQIGVLRFIAALGMGGEWSLGVALVMEVWPNRSRAYMAGLIGAAANVGYLLVGVIGIGLVAMLSQLTMLLGKLGLSHDTVETLTHHNGWRLMMMIGGFPAILTFLIRIFVPESEKWEDEKATGSTSHWAAVDLLGVLIGACGPGLIIFVWAYPDLAILVRVVGTLVGVTVALLGYLYPVMRYVQRLAVANPADSLEWRPTLRRLLLAAGLSGVALLGTWGSMQWAPFWAGDAVESQAQAENIDTTAISAHPKEITQIWSAIGAIIGTIGAALVGERLGRRPTYALLCVLSIISLSWLYQGHTRYDNEFLFATFVAATFSAAFYGWLPLYLPELFRTKVRATGQGFGFNFGRIIAAIGTLQAGKLSAQHLVVFGTEVHACAALSLIYVVGFVLIWFAPETKGQPLPD